MARVVDCLVDACVVLVRLVPGRMLEFQPFATSVAAPDERQASNVAECVNGACTWYAYVA